ncbi:MAG TPA: glutamate-1-semialdehyde 2,1-aminomutase [Planctomycetota bacterium]|nr:glutamate-1-semialdehyde 2,1-aminomutase [Planctomycetota bacterium]
MIPEPTPTPTPAPRKTRRSAKAFELASQLFPGGVNSPVRSWRSVGGDPFFVDGAKGAWLRDIDGNRYVDFIGSWGPMILGHGHKRVVSAVRKQARRGFSYGAPTELESRLAELVRTCVPSMEMLRFVSSGTEAVMHALRVARGFTGRSKIVKFEGCYHGASDAVLVKAGSGVATFGLPDSAGVPAESAGNTLTAPFNDLAAVRALFEANKGQIAAVILEPVVGNAGVLIPHDNFLKDLRALTAAEGALLIFDEVMTGFRLSRGGAQQLYGIAPDLTTLGKILGGGLPCAAYGGRAEIMHCVAPLGPVYQAGTLSGNPLAMAAGIATLKELAEPGIYSTLEEISAEIATTISAAAAETGWSDKVCINRVGSMFTLFFCKGPVFDFAGAKTADAKLYAAFFRALLDGGVYFPPSQFEAAFVSLAMNRKALKRTAKAVNAAFVALGAG